MIGPVNSAVPRPVLGEAREKWLQSRGYTFRETTQSGLVFKLEKGHPVLYSQDLVATFPDFVARHPDSLDELLLEPKR